jgi:hypothetical protein
MARITPKDRGDVLDSEVAIKDNVDEKRWFEKINYDELAIPYIIRPQRGTRRINFTGGLSLYDKALEIKESAPHKYKHTGDVDRNAHYIGIYMLWQRDVVAMKGRKCVDKARNASDSFMRMADERQAYRDMVSALFDRLHIGTLDEEELAKGVYSIMEAIEGEEKKEWFIKMIEKMYNDTDTFSRGDKKIKMRLKRAKAKAAGLSVITNEEN